MRPYPLIISVSMLLVSLMPAYARADLRLYVGYLDVVTTSGKACEGMRGRHQISMVLNVDEEERSYSGLLGGDSVAVGRLAGASTGNLSLRYPFSEASLAEGHSLKFVISGNKLTGELRDKHIDASADDCNFDLARLTMTLSEQDDAVYAAYQKLSAQFDAQLSRSIALSQLRAGKYADAVMYYEKALAYADKVYPPGSPKLTSYLAGLANSYMRLGQFADLISLHSERYPSITDEALRATFNEHLLRSHLHLGRSAMNHEEYPLALDHFRKALAINNKSRDAIAGIMSVYIRSGQHDEAIEFLEQTEKRLESEPARRDVRGAIALVHYQKARKDDKAGRPAEAEASLLKAIKLDPETVQYLIIQARWRHKAGNYAEADAILKKALDRFKNDPARTELNEAREKLRLTEMMLKKIRGNGG